MTAHYPALQQIQLNGELEGLKQDTRQNRPRALRWPTLAEAVYSNDESDRLLRQKFPLALCGMGERSQ